MNEYHKIQTVFKRSEESNYKALVEGDFTLPEFELLKDVEWTWTEKIDGTNIRIMWDGETVRFGGRTENAQIPTFLLSVLQDTFLPEKMKAVFTDSNNVCLYGEGYGAKIQKGDNYIPDRTDFILFDAKIDDWWLSRENIEDVANSLGIKVVPIIGKGGLLYAVEYVKKGFTSTIASNKDYVAEGLIMKPTVDLFNRKGERIVAKIKHRDFYLTNKNTKK